MSLKEDFEEIEGYINRGNFCKAISSMKDIANEYGQEETADKFIDTEMMDDFVRARLESGGWQGVACCLSDVNYLNDDYYEIDGYGNLKDVTSSSLECTLSDLKRNLEDELKEEEEENEEDEEE